MPSNPTLHSDGTVISWEEIAANAADARAWVNAIPDADIDDGVIRREHLVRPIVSGFPIQGMVSTLQEAHTADFGVEGTGADVHQDEAWGALPDRYTIVPLMNDGDEEVWRTPLARTIHLHREADVEVHAIFQSKVTADGDAASYPDGASGPANAARAGHFILHVTERSTGTLTKATSGLQHVYPPEAGASPKAEDSYDSVHLSFVDTLDAGVWDFQVVYKRDSAPEEVSQIDLTRATLTIEVL